MKLKRMAYGIFVFQQIIIPLTSDWIGGLYADIVHYSYPFIIICAIICIQCVRRFKLSQIINRQFQYVLAYSLASVNVIFIWHLAKDRNQQNTLDAIVTYLCQYLQVVLYSFFMPKTKTELLTVVSCAVFSLVINAYYTVQVIEIQDMSDLRKNLFIGWLAAEIGLYSFLMEDARSRQKQQRQRHEKQSSLESLMGV